jgi:outer membrane biosynthesis protein TonB
LNSPKNLLPVVLTLIVAGFAAAQAPKQDLPAPASSMAAARPQSVASCVLPASTPNSPSPASSASPHEGRAVVCACTDASGTLTRDPLIVESTGRAAMDAAAIKLAQSGSGHYKPSTENGKPVAGCFKFAIEFKLTD